MVRSSVDRGAASLLALVLLAGCGGGASERAPLDDGPPVEIWSTNCAALAVISPGEEPPSRWREPLAPYVDPLLESGLAPGLVVGVVTRGESGEREVEIVGFGRLAPDDSRRPDGTTLYEIGSITKVFTAILLADAVERGELTLDTLAATSLPDSARPLPGSGEGITLEHLATHRSALPRIPSNLPGTDLVDPYAGYSFDDMVAFLSGWSFLGTPGDRYAYSNLGAGWLGEIVARRAGAPYGELLRTRLCAPLRLPETGVELPPGVTARLAPPHRDGVPVSEWHLGVLAGAGGIRSTAHDLVRFVALHLGDEIAEGVEPTTLRDAMRAAYEQRVPGMGLGWHIAGDGVTRWHNGQTGGYSTAMFVNRFVGKGVVVLANGASGQVDVVAEKIFQRICGLEPPVPLIRPSIPRTPEQLVPLVGTYDSNLGFAIEVTREGTALFAQLTQQVSIRVYPSSPTRFFYRDIAAELEFEFADGAAPGEPASAVTLLQNGREMRCVRRAE